VKWFNGQKGYGFVQPDDGGKAYRPSSFGIRAETGHHEHRKPSTSVPTLGDPPPHRSALAEFASRPAPPEPTISIAPRAEWLARRDKAAAGPEERREYDEEADGEAKRRREYEKTRKRRWRAGRKAATLHDAAARFAARA
jgi:hypothetical protein